MARDTQDWSWKPDPDVVQALKKKPRPKRRRKSKSKKRRGSGFSKRHLRLLEMPGHQFYETLEWKRLRGRAFGRWGRRCMRCDREDGVIQVDHIKPRSKYPELSLDIDNLQILCKACNKEKLNYHSTDYRQEAIERWADEEHLKSIEIFIERSEEQP